MAKATGSKTSAKALADQAIQLIRELMAKSTDSEHETYRVFADEIGKKISEVVDGKRINRPATPEEEAKYEAWIKERYPNGMYLNGLCGEPDCPCSTEGDLHKEEQQQSPPMTTPLTEERMFPIQCERGAAPHPTRIPWSVADLAYSVYSGKYGRSQSLQTLADRGGFGPGEMDQFLPGWRELCSELTDLRKRLAEVEADRDMWRDHTAPGKIWTKLERQRDTLRDQCEAMAGALRMIAETDSRLLMHRSMASNAIADYEAMKSPERPGA